MGQNRIFHRAPEDIQWELIINYINSIRYAYVGVIYTKKNCKEIDENY